MNTKGALAALKIIDAKVEASTAGELTQEDLKALEDASRLLLEGVQGDAYALKAAGKVTHLVEAGFLWFNSNPANYRQGILEHGRLLASYLRKQP